MATNDDNTSLAKATAALVGWPDTAAPVLTLLPGGATGRTYKLTADGQDDAYCVRALRDGGADDGYVTAAKALAAAGVSPPVVASSPSLLVTQFMSDCRALKVTDLASGDASHVSALGTAVAKLHGVDPESVGAAARDEMAHWQALAESKLPELDAALRDALRAEAEATRAATATTEPAARIVTAHGDLHPGNVLVPSDSEAASTPDVWLVDLEHVGPRAAVFDIGYLFAVWGDLRYHAGWAPSAETPTPYAPLDARQAFTKAYLTAVTGSPPSDAAVQDFLLQVELCGHHTRTRLAYIWLLLAGGDPKHMMVGAAASYLPYLTEARAMLSAIAGGDDAVAADVVRLGLIVAASARVAAAAVAAGAGDSASA